MRPPPAAEFPDTNGGIDPIRLVDGQVLDVRPITGDDGEALVRFHSALSMESTRRRYFSPHPRLSAREVDYFTRVDHHRREALVATIDGDIVGVARFDRLEDTDEAEVAFVVADDWQERGLGTAMLERLIVRGRQEGISHFVADTLVENHPMLDVFAATGRPLVRSMSQGVVHVTFPIR